MVIEPRGGGGAHVLALARASAASGDEPELVTLEAFSPEFPHVSLRSARASRVLRRADIVHCHGVRSGLAMRLLLARPTILTPHGLHALRGSRGVHHFVARELTRHVLHSAGHIVCVSESELADVLRLIPGKRAQLHLIHNGVPSVTPPTERQRLDSRRRLGLSDKVPVLVFLGGVRYQKNPLLAADAVELALKQVPGLVLLVAGEGPLLSELNARKSDSLRVLGQRNDTHELLIAADAVLNTSRWEGLSLALLEGLWRGRPLIVTDAPGNAEAAGDAGLVVAQEASAVARAIDRLFTEPQLLPRLAKRARARAEEMFDEKRMIEETLRLYGEVS